MISVLRRLLRRQAAPQGHGFDLFLGGNRGARNVLIFTEYVNATYFISFDIPLRRLHADGKVNLAVASQRCVGDSGPGCWDRWADEFRPDVVVMTRYGLPHGPAILDAFRQRGIPVVYHIDDDLLEVPDSLGAEIKQRQGAGDMVEARGYLLANCDLIYASTRHLAETLGERFPGQPIFQGIYAPYMGDELGAVQKPARAGPIVGYMGSKGHQHDLELAVPALERLLEERPTLEFEVFGTIRMPPALERFGKRVRSRSVQKSYREFLATLAGLGWDIGLAPLVDAPFNRCKAPTKYIEYSAAGIPVLATDISVYRDAMPAGGGMLVGDDWYGAISRWLDAPQSAEEALSVARDHCGRVFGLSVLERQVSDLFDRVPRGQRESAKMS